MSGRELVLHQVGKKVDNEVHLQAVDLRLATGLTVLIGPTLSGKTSLMRLMAGLDRPTTGHLSMDGVDLTGLPVQRRNVAMVYQQFINYPSLNVYDNIASPLKVAGVARAEIDRRVRETAELLHIDELLDRLPGELSGGQQQRTAMARALVKEADLLLFDEPLVNLDYKLREELRVEMREIFARRDAIVVYATTEPLEALLLGGTTVVMDEGRVLQHGATLDVYLTPANLRVGEVFSDPPMNMAEGRMQDGELLIGDDLRVPASEHLSDLAPGRYRFGIRANHLSTERGSEHDVVVQAHVELSEVNGSETFVHVVHGPLSWVVQQGGVQVFRVGGETTVYLPPQWIYAFDRSGGLVAAPPQRGRGG